MRLIYIANVRMPTEKAHGIQMIKMCEAFADERMEVEFVVPKRFNPIKIDPFDYYGVARNFKIKKIFTIDIIELVPRIGFWIQYISFLFAAVFKFLFISRKDNLIYTREFLIAAFFEMLGFRTVYEAHRIILKKGFFFYILKNIDKIITNSEGTADAFKEQGFKKVIPYPNGVDLKDFNFDFSKQELREKLKLPKDKKIVMYTGALYDWKGIDVMYDAAKISKNNDKLLFILVGGSDKDVAKYSEAIKNDGLGNIEFLGHKDKKNIPYYIKAADILLLPNIPISEESIKYTSPVKLPEYMASGTPIIASDMPSIRKILSDKDAVLIKPGDADLMLKSIDGLLKNDALYKSISAQARRTVEEKYTWDKRAKKIINFIGLS